MVAPINMVDQRFGRLEVIRRDGNTSLGQAKWACKCDCGNFKTVSRGDLKSGKVKSCGCMRHEPSKNRSNLVGQRFERLLVLSESRKKFNKTYWRCQCDCGNIRVVSAGGLLRGHNRSCGCWKADFVFGHNRAYLVGQRFGRLIVVKTTSSNHRGNQLWECVCDCGKTVSTITAYLLCGDTQSCGCLKTDSQSERLFDGYKELSGTYFGSVKQNAIARGLAVSITKKYVWERFERQQGLCALSGVPIVLPKKHSSQQTASLDRIDSSAGYVRGNIWWVHKHVNKIKSHLSLGEFCVWCQIITVNQKRYSIGDCEAYSLDDYASFADAYWKSINRGALSRELTVTLSKRACYEVYKQQNGVCALSGVPLVLRRNWGKPLPQSQTASLDRIDSSHGYINGNIQWIHKRLQRMKWNYSNQDFITWCRLVDKHRNSWQIRQSA